MPDYNSTDLTSVLRTLSALSNQKQPQYPNNAPQNSNTPQEGFNDDAYEPSETIIPIAPTSSQSYPTQITTTTTPSHSYPRPQPQPQPQTQHHKQPNTNFPNTSIITTWPPALKHVVRTVSANEDLQRKIRWLIQRQHDHERQWWEGREALVRKQKARVEKKKELDAVLRSVGAPVDEKEISTAEENRAELDNYDMKVYKASRQMADAMMGELRALQIPFFSIKQSLVFDSAGKEGAGLGVGSLHSTGDSRGQRGLGSDELAVLRRRMLELLQDLCRE